MGLATGQWWIDTDSEVNQSILLLPSVKQLVTLGRFCSRQAALLLIGELTHPINKHLILIFMIFSIGVFLNSQLHSMHWIVWHLLGHGNLLQCMCCKLNWSWNFCQHLFTIWEKWATNGRGLKLNCCTCILVMFWLFERRKDIWSTIPHQLKKRGTENKGKYLF